MARTKRIHQMTIGQWEKAFPTDAHCKAYLQANRWPLGVRCARCGSEAVHEVATMEFKWQCYDCSNEGYRFSVLVGTIFENTNKPLREWFRVIHLMLTSKKGISALQIYRMMGFGSYQTAWHMCHRIRAGLANQDFRKLMGIVEVDETYIGGKDSNKHGPHDRHHRRPSNKIAVIGAVERKGSVMARVLSRVDSITMQKFVREAVSTEVSLLATDEHRGYQGLNEFPHGSVNHAAKRYVIGAVHTNTIEGFWSLIKRSIVGSYHKVSRKYLPLYVAEAQFRYNNRNNPDIFGEAIRAC